jgi:hypothetical protein
VPLALQDDGRDQALDLGGLALRLLALLGGQRPLDDVLADVVLLALKSNLINLFRSEFTDEKAN